MVDHIQPAFVKCVSIYTLPCNILTYRMKKILLIDDDQGIIDLISQYLVKEEYEIFTAEDGPSGLKAANSYHPDLVVLDVMLPSFDGIELLTKLRQKSNAYVIMLTAKTEETDKVVGLTVGADDYMIKPESWLHV